MKNSGKKEMRNGREEGGKKGQRLKGSTFLITQGKGKKEKIYMHA